MIICGLLGLLVHVSKCFTTRMFVLLFLSLFLPFWSLFSLTLTCSLLLPESCLCSLGVPVCCPLSYLALSGSGPVSRSQPVVRARPAPEPELVVKGEKGRELRVVVNTHDPDYEHIYSIEAYDDPNEELLYFTPSSNQSDAPADLCLLPMEEGSCGRYTLRWYFNSQVQACRPFIYSGCEGNDNRFLHLEECEEVCLGEAKGTHSVKTAR
ncbi:collagen alpha-1(XXVIII) chain isoform X2 [Thunnus thynnus]|uniref:collagen alpha-1(XXVIII) chain isoform X2 n=1 Tax=Thunnus thynnus TaxID=8237 RepID=UPI0035274E62